MQSTMTNDKNEKTVDHLNSFLRGEISAVETYRLAISKLETSPHRATLERCQRSHKERVELLCEEILRMGGEPATSSGAWGTFARLVEGGAALFGEKAAVAALEDGEDHGRDDYKRGLDELDPVVRLFVQNRILPEQLRTHQALERVKQSL